MFNKKINKLKHTISGLMVELAKKDIEIYGLKNDIEFKRDNIKELIKRVSQADEEVALLRKAIAKDRLIKLIEQN